MKKKLLATTAAIVIAATAILATAEEPIYLFCGAGDNLYNTAVEPVDSPAAIDAMLDYTASTHGAKRLYWRAIGDWASDMHVERTLSPITWDWTQWLTYLNAQFNPDATAARLAHAHGMEAFCYAGLFEFGLQPDASAGYRFEFSLRRKHPEWIATDRWGERREPGPISFTIPEARKALVDYFTNLVLRDGFDGINFYTYVENFGIHYEHEFGFEPAVVSRFNERYPEVDLRTATLTAEQASYWYDCRGHFVTLFLKELSASLHSAGKRLSMILAAEEPEFNQPWWGMPIRGNGKIRMEYEKWIKDGIVDELWVQLAETAAQRRTLDKLLPLVAGTPVKLTVRAVSPFDEGWRKYRQVGVVPIAVITWARNGIEPYVRGTLDATALHSADWKARAQVLRQAADGNLKATPEALLPLLSDPAILVRRWLYRALAAVAADGHPELLPVIEDGLQDAESCVRIAASLALQKANRPESVDALMAAVEAHPMEFQLKNSAVDAFTAIGAAGYSRLEAYLGHRLPVIRELAARGLRKLAIHKLVDMAAADAICSRFQEMMMKAGEDTFLRMTLVEQTVGMRTNVSAEQQRKLADDVISLVESEADWEVQLKVAGYSGHMAPLLAVPQRQRLKEALIALFRKYGDGCQRPDAGYGWRDVGNALLLLGAVDAFGPMMQQRDDAFLAYCAYQVVYDRQGSNPESRKHKGFNIINEATAVENHRKYAPPFPGYRSW